MSYCLRAMTVQDIPQVVEIEKKCFSTPWSEYAFTCELSDNQLARYLIVTDKEEPLKVMGYGGMWLICDEAHITNIAITPAYRGLGLSLLLMEGLITLAKSEKAERMTLEVRISNEVAQDLYRKLHFVAAGIRPGYYTDNHEDALIMWKELWS